MAYHDFSCPLCGETVEAYRPITERATDHPPLHCGVPMLWIPAFGAMDLKSEFQKFTANIRQRDGSYKAVEIDSVSKMRQIERDTERAAANHEGEALRFRAWSQDDSNGDVNAFGPMCPPPLDPAIARKYGLRSGTIKSVEAPTVELGPGVTDANVSPLLGE